MGYMIQSIIRSLIVGGLLSEYRRWRSRRRGSRRD